MHLLIRVAEVVGSCMYKEGDSFKLEDGYRLVSDTPPLHALPGGPHATLQCAESLAPGSMGIGRQGGQDKGIRSMSGPVGIHGWRHSHSGNHQG